MSDETARCDVAVVGGGPAGIAAAIAAAETGARTVLLERDATLGGNVAQALVHTICGLYRADAARAEPAHAGLPLRFAEALARAGGAGAPEAAGRVHYLPIRPPAFAALAAAWCAATPGLEVRTGHALVGAALAREPRAPSRLRVRGPQGEAELEAALVVDSSGDAAAAALGGAETAMAPPETLQRPSFVFRIEGVAPEACAGFARLRLAAGIARAARDGALPPGADSLVVRGDGDGAVHATLALPALAGEPYAPLDPAHLEALARFGRRRAEAVVAFLRATRPGFADARVAAWPARVGVRETRRLVGRVVLDREDVLAGRRRDDEVALSTWPIELWDDHRRARFEHPAGPCSVPLGALVSRSHPRLGMAGRCLSATHEALGALRVIGTALATGEAIGIAAALAADGGTGLAAIAPARVRREIAAHAARAGSP